MLLKHFVVVILFLTEIIFCNSLIAKRQSIIFQNSGDLNSKQNSLITTRESIEFTFPQLSPRPDDIIYSRSSNGSVLLASWNLKDFGNSKSVAEIDFIANVIKQFDVIAIQEVVAGAGGPQAVARLADALNRKGSKWSYAISDPTSGNSYKRERYAFLWQPGKLTKTGDTWLEKQYNIEIDREPFFATFRKGGKTFTIASFHAITKSLQPETEIKYFKFLPSQYPGKNIIFSGDFNCPQSHSVFNPLKKMGYQPVFINQKTSLKKSCKTGDCLASEFDNVFYDKNKVTFIKSGVLHFYRSFTEFSAAANISDHIPVVFEFSLN